MHRMPDSFYSYLLSSSDSSADSSAEVSEEVAEEVNLERQARGANFTFSSCQIPVGAILENIDDSTITCTVVDDRRIEYNGETMYITPFAKMISGKDYITKGPKFLAEHFKYDGEFIKDRLERLGVW